MAVDMNKLVNLERLKEFQTSENAATASEFSTSKSYAAGAYVYYKGKLYKFKSAHAAGAWTTTDVEEAKLADDVSSLKESFNQESSSIITNIFKGLFLSEGETAYDGRVVKRNRNKITISRTNYGNNNSIHSLTGNTFLIENLQDSVLNHAEELYNNRCFVDFPLIYGQAQIVIETIASGIRNTNGYITFITRREGKTPTYHYINSANIAEKMYNARAFTTEMITDLKTEGTKICIVAYLQGGFQGDFGDAFIETSAVIKLPDTSSLALALSN